VFLYISSHFNLKKFIHSISLSLSLSLSLVFFKFTFAKEAKDMSSGEIWVQSMFIKSVWLCVFYNIYLSGSIRIFSHIISSSSTTTTTTYDFLLLGWSLALLYNRTKHFNMSRLQILYHILVNLAHILLHRPQIKEL